MRYRSLGLILISLVLTGGCDLLNQTAVIPPEGVDGLQRPTTLSEPDSVLRLLEYLFDNHRPKDADDYGDLLYAGYVYRYDNPTDSMDLVLTRADEINVYHRLFAAYQDISASFTERQRWSEYGSHETIPAGTPSYQISSAHPDENWVVLRVYGDMRFSTPLVGGIPQNPIVSQEFDIAFRDKPGSSPTTWQIASWTDRAPTWEAQ